MFSHEINHHDYFHLLSQPLTAILFSPQIEPGISTSDILSWIKQEEEPQVGAPQESKESDMHKGAYAGE